MPDDGEFSLPISWHVSENIISRYANNIVVQHTETEFVVSFFEIVPPLVLGSQSELTERLSKIEGVRAECVARIVVHPKKMKEFVGALQNNLDKFRERFESKE